MKYSDVLLQPLKNHKFKVKKDFTYKLIKVPKGYVTDGASIPRIFWCLFPPNRPDYLPCAIIHDYLCDLKRYRYADYIFKNCLKDLGVNKFIVYIFYYAVRVYHIVRYKT